MNKIFCIMGKSSSGKDSVYKSVLKMLPLEPLVIYTTRPMREHETDGKEYHFTDNEGFLRMKSEGKVIESRTYHTVHGDWTYFTSGESIDLDSHSYAIIGTPQSFVPIREHYGIDRVIPVYIEVEDGERLSRALAREKQEESPKYAEMCRRFLADCEDFSDDKLDKAGITKRFSNSGSFDECVNAVAGYIKSLL